MASSSNLYQAHHTALKYALQRDIQTDIFVISRTVQRIIANLDIFTEKEIRSFYDLVSEYMNDDELYALDLVETFCSSEEVSKKSLCLKKNIGILENLKRKLSEEIGLYLHEREQLI